jgi:hypothetical protein
MQRLEVSCAVRPVYGSLGTKGLINLPVILELDVQFDLLYHTNSNIYISLNDCDEFFIHTW